MTQKSQSNQPLESTSVQHKKPKKKANKNPTPRQRKAAIELVKNLISKKPKPTGQVIGNVGYNKGAIDNPGIVLRSEGFKKALAEIGLKEALINQGINPQKIAEKIDVLLNAKETNANGEIKGDDYTAIDKGLKHATAIYGIIQDKPIESKNTYNFILIPEVRKDIDTINERIKKQLRGYVEVPTEEKETKAT